jgi:hypothetical protein
MQSEVEATDKYEDVWTESDILALLMAIKIGIKS